MPKTAFNWKVVGAAGEGIKSTGLIFSKTCLRSHLYTFDYTEYPSLIRGGHNTYQVYASTEPVYAQSQKVDLLLTLDQLGLDLHRDELTPQSSIIVDAQDLHLNLSDLKYPCPVIDLPLTQLAKSVGAERVMANNVALGASVYLLSLDLTILKAVIADTFKGKDAQIINLNQLAAQAGYDFAAKNLTPICSLPTPQTGLDDLTISGNEALSLGAIAGGMKAYVAYPMTPSSSILHSLAEWAQTANIFVKHAEDEIGAINMALGLSYAGVRSACGTSGGGFCYMTEAVGLAGVAELPLVIFEAQRPGPALGMPTWTAQADLLFVINASQDEFPRLVLAPGDVAEAFTLAQLAFDFAEDFQIPVIILSDKHLSESNQSTHLDSTKFSHRSTSLNSNPALDETGYYPRYAVNSTGLSLRTVPGQPNGFYLANSYEHDHHGLASESATDRVEQVDKRFKKLETLSSQLPPQFTAGSNHPQIAFLSWGSTKGAIRQALPRLHDLGIEAAMLNLSWLWPFPVDQVTAFIQANPTTVIIEGNQTHQLAQLIRQQTGLDIYHKRTKYDGRPFFPEEIVSWAKEILNL